MASPIGSFAEELVDFIEYYFGWLLTLFSDILDQILDLVGSALTYLDPIVFIPILMIVSLLITKRLVMSLMIGVAFYIIYWMGYWNSAMVTLNMVLVATLVAVVLAVPLGIWAADSERANPVIKALMDFMQTMPAFVYLIPAVIFFGLGVVPGVVATVIFAMPPVVRLTNLGIRQVPQYTVEELGISRISDLKAHAGVFDGEIIGIDAGAGIMEMAEKAIKDYDLNSFKLTASSEAVMLSALDAAYNNHEHIVVTLWDPHWATGTYNIVYLEDPNLSFGEAESIESWARPGLKAEDAVLADLMERYTYEVSEFNGLLAHIGNRADIEAATREWLDSNTETYDMWIGDATHQENRGEIKIGLVNWACAVGSSNVLKHLLEDLGYTVNLTVVDAGAMYTGLANGDIDLITTAWVPLTHKHYMEMYA